MNDEQVARILDLVSGSGAQAIEALTAYWAVRATSTLTLTLGFILGLSVLLIFLGQHIRRKDPKTV